MHRIEKNNIILPFDFLFVPTPSNLKWNSWKLKTIETIAISKIVTLLRLLSWYIDSLMYCYVLVIFHSPLSSADYFHNWLFQEHNQSVSPDLGSICLQRLSADDKIHCWQAELRPCCKIFVSIFLLVTQSIMAAMIHRYIDEIRYESHRYRIDTQAHNVSIFSRKLMRNYYGKTKCFFSVSKSSVSVKFYFSILSEKIC